LYFFLPTLFLLVFRPRLSAPAPTCQFPFWELSAHRLCFPRSPHWLRLWISTSRRCFLDGVGAAARGDLPIGRCFDFLIYSPLDFFFLGRVLENACDRGLVLPGGVS
jgi:hypothetical protein